MSELFPYLIIGLATGSLYGLAGVGLVLTYRTSGIFNFAHGAIAAGAAFLFYTLHFQHGMAWPLAAAVTMVLFGVVVGLAMELVTHPLADAPPAVAVVATIGIVLLTEGFLFIQYGDVTRRFPDFLPTSGVTLSGVRITWSQAISFAIAAAGAGLLYLFLRRAKLGVAMRAVVDNPPLVSLTGERPRRILRAAWMIGSAFAALSGILLAPTLGLDANLLTFLVVQAFGACAIGLFSSLPLTFAGGLLVGVLGSLATRYVTRVPFTGIPSAVPLIVLIVVLLVVPVAKLPQRQLSRRTFTNAGTRLSRRTVTVLCAAAGVALLIVPHVVGPKLPLWINGLTYTVIFGSLALLVFTSGQISLCHASFVALGATSFAHLTSAHVPWAIALVLAGVCTAPVGALIAIPAIRLSGIYLALITLGFGIVMQNVIFATWLMFGAHLSVTASRPQLGFIDGSNDKWLYYVVLAVAVLTLLMLTALQRGRLGRLLGALAETPTMLTTVGLGVNVTRLIVFSLSAFCAGIGGALAVTETGSVSGVGFGPIQSLLLLAVLAICGTRLVRTSVLAAGLFAVVPGYVSSFNVNRQLFSFGAVALIAAIVVSQQPRVAAWRADALKTVDGRDRAPWRPLREAAGVP